MVDVEFRGDLAASLTPTPFCTFLLVSRAKKDSFELLIAQHLASRVRVPALLNAKFGEAESVVALDPLSLRQGLSSKLGKIMTAHLLEVQNHQERDRSDVVSYTAWRYRTLTTWGEASAARELSRAMQISVHTIHNRIRIARERGILEAPGPGARLGR